MMKKIGWIVMTILIGVLPVAHAEEVWKITSLNWEPYSGAEMSQQGNSIVKLREILKSKGIRLVVEFYPWKRAQKLAKSEAYVGYFPAWPEEVYEGFVGSLPVDWSEVGIMKRMGTPNIPYESIDDLFKNNTIGIVKTYAYPEQIQKAMKKYPKHAQFVSDEMALLRALSSGRFQLALTDPTVMTYLAERHGIDNVETMAVLMRKELVVAFRDKPDNKPRIELLNDLLKSSPN